ncbi:MAG: ATPase [candidate division Zixibacteria bacterium]|nr:ATPase [Candidatus Tariuqbacter arcticus]
MRFAVPMADGKLCAHFGHSEKFALIDVNTDTKEIITSVSLNPPPHEPGILPRWLQQNGVTHIITGGMGIKAQSFFRQLGIDVVVGAPIEEPELLVKKFIDGNLVKGENICDH